MRTLLLLTIALTAAAEPTIRELQSDLQYESYDDNGDCLGLGRSYGHGPSHFVQSDMQFVQQAREHLRSLRDPDSQKLAEHLYFDLQMRFFAQPEYAFSYYDPMVANNFKISYSVQLAAELSAVG